MDAQLEFRPNRHGFEDSIMCLTRAYCADAAHCRTRPKLHYHEHIELLYGVSGDAVVFIGDRRYTMEPGDLVIVNKKEAHEVICEAGSVRYYVIKFLPELLLEQGRGMTGVRYLFPLWEKTSGALPRIPADALADSGIGALAEEIMREWEGRARGYEAVIHADILKLFIITVRLRCPDAAAPSDIPESLHHALAAALDAAQKNPVGLSVKDAARICGLSYSYFSRSFKAAFGMTFTAYCETLRMREAERLLLTTGREVTDIAAALGFATTSYFIERFRTLYGTTPQAFRRTVMAADENRIPLPHGDA